LPPAGLQTAGEQTPESGAAPHTPGMPAPLQTNPFAQSPQSIVPPHPLPTLPQYLPELP
jgi:hypothetical protein